MVRLGGVDGYSCICSPHLDVFIVINVSMKLNCTLKMLRGFGGMFV